MVVKARQGGTGRVRGGRPGAQQGGGSSPGSPVGDGGPDFQIDFTTASSLPAWLTMTTGTASFSGSGIVIDTTNIVGVISGALTAMMGTAGTIILEASYTDPTNGGYCVGTNSGAAIIFTSAHYGTYNNTTELDTSGTITAATPSRCAYSWNASGRSIVADGGTVATDSATNPALTAIYLGAAGGDHTFAPGSYRKLAIYSSRLSDATLQTKSAVGAAF
jgi:hypothetical protein